MKYYIKVWYSLCLLIGLLASCNEDGNLVPTGTLYLNVEEDQTLQTRATSEVTYESLQVAILQGEEDTLKVYNDYLTEVKGQRLVLPVGKYTVAVRSNGADGVAWETPLYQGSEEVEVKQGEITNTKVTCTIANTKVSVVYADDLNEYFTDYQTTVSTPSGALLYTRDEYRAGFFTPEKLTVLLKLVNNDGNEFVIKKVYPDIEPQYHYTFKFTISNGNTDDEAGADVDVDVDKEHQEITYNIFVKEEELTNIGEPSAKLGGAFTGGVYTFKRTVQNQNPASNTISLDYILGSKNTLQSFVVTMDSPTGVSRFDITKGEGNGIGFPAVPGSSVETDDPRYTAYRMDLSTIVQHLECLNEQPTEYTFKVDILDDKYQETSITFVIKMMPDVAASVEKPYCWNTFALLKGNSSTEDIYFKFQSEDGSVIDIKSITSSGDDVSALVIGLETGVEYTYWLTSDTDPTMNCNTSSFVLSAPSAVPNLKFEDWTDQTSGYLDAPIVGGNKKYISPNKDPNNTYWNSGNLGAMATKEILTESVEDVIALSISKKAARLISKYPSAAGMGAFAAGSVYSGSPKEVSSKGAVLTYGQPFQGYPTKLRGFYKYIPETIDDSSKEIDSRCPVKMDGKKDQAIIYIALIPKQFEVVSKTSGTIMSFNKANANAFAYGEYIITDTKNETGKDVEGIQNDYAPFEISLQYDDAIPRTGQYYIVIVATSSRYGDYFTGAIGSCLYIDEFELDYDYDPASFSNTNLKDMKAININD